MIHMKRRTVDLELGQLTRKPEDVLLKELEERKTVVGVIFLKWLSNHDKIPMEDLEKAVKTLEKKRLIRTDQTFTMDGELFHYIRYIGNV